MKNFFLISCLLCSISLFGQEIKKSTQNDVVIENYMQLTLKQLYDTSLYYFGRYSYDTALIYNNIILNTHLKNNDYEQEKTIFKTLNQTALIYAFMCDYRTSYEYFIKSLIMCEKPEFQSYKHSIYNNIGIIYDKFNKLDFAKDYFYEALRLCEDSINMVICLNNLGHNCIKRNRIDSAFFYLNKSLQISQRHNNVYLDMIFSSFAEGYQITKQYDSAFYYFNLSLDEAIKNNRSDIEAEILSKFGNMFFEVSKYDIAMNYIDLSNNIALNKKFSGILADNYLTLSKIEESKGSVKRSFEFYKNYANIKDSIFSADKFGEINQLQRLYEVSKKNQEIEQLIIEQQIKERTNKYLRIIQIITSCILLIVSIIVVVFFLQKRKLNFKNNILVSKNLEILELLKKDADTKENKDKKNLLNDNTTDDIIKNSLEIMDEKDKKSLLNEKAIDDLLIKISKVMEDIETVCNPNFSLIKLSELVKYNHRYVSDVINKTYKQNFRSYLNRFRIREAQRIFSELDSNTFKIQTIAQQVGFKSLNAFYEAFKEVTGVNPGQYLKNMRNQVL